MFFIFSFDLLVMLLTFAVLIVIFAIFPWVGIILIFVAVLIGIGFYDYRQSLKQGVNT